MKFFANCGAAKFEIKSRFGSPYAWLKIYRNSFPQNFDSPKMKTKCMIAKDALLTINQLHPHVTCNPAQLSTEECISLDLLIEELLESGQIVTAREVAAHFKYHNQDLDIVSVSLLFYFHPWY
jgi:hypothetical protein